MNPWNWKRRFLNTTKFGPRISKIVDNKSANKESHVHYLLLYYSELKYFSKLKNCPFFPQCHKVPCQVCGPEKCPIEIKQVCEDKEKTVSIKKMITNMNQVGHNYQLEQYRLDKITILTQKVSLILTRRFWKVNYLDSNNTTFNTFSNNIEN